MPTKLERNLAYYRSRHLTPGCRLSHLLGIPTLLLAPVVFLFNPKAAVRMLALGFVFQVGGHFIFEKNRPVLFETKEPLTLVSAIIFTIEQVTDVFTGEWFKKNDLTRLWEPMEDGKVLEETRQEAMLRDGDLPAGASTKPYSPPSSP